MNFLKYFTRSISVYSTLANGVVLKVLRKQSCVALYCKFPYSSNVDGTSVGEEVCFAILQCLLSLPTLSALRLSTDGLREYCSDSSGCLSSNVKQSNNFIELIITGLL